jgi:hypothetical protein
VESKDNIPGKSISLAIGLLKNKTKEENLNNDILNGLLS